MQPDSNPQPTPPVVPTPPSPLGPDPLGSPATPPLAPTPPPVVPGPPKNSNHMLVWIVSAVLVLAIIGGLVWWLLAGKSSSNNNSSSSSNSSQQSSQSDGLGDVYTSTDASAKFTIKPPKDWATKENYASGTIVDFSYQRIDAGIAYIDVDYQPHAAGSTITLDSAVSAELAYIKQTDTGAQILSNKSTTAGSTKAVLLEWTDSRGGSPEHTMELILLKDQNVYFIVFNASGETNWNKFKAVGQASLESFRLQ